MWVRWIHRGRVYLRLLVMVGKENLHIQRLQTLEYQETALRKALSSVPCLLAHQSHWLATLRSMVLDQMNHWFHPARPSHVLIQHSSRRDR